MAKDPKDLCSGEEIQWTKMTVGNTYDVKPPQGAKPFRGNYRGLDQSSDYNANFMFATKGDEIIRVAVSSQFFLLPRP